MQGSITVVRVLHRWMRMAKLWPCYGVFGTHTIYHETISSLGAIKKNRIVLSKRVSNRFPCSDSKKIMQIVRTYIICSIVNKESNQTLRNQIGRQTYK